jgi:hypothetical protein
MPNLEKLENSNNYQPNFNNLQEIAEADEAQKLSDQELLLEIAKQKYIKGQGTIELMKKLKDYPADTQKRLKEFISIVALTDLPKEEIMTALEDKNNKDEILESINLIEKFKKK